MSFTKAWKQNHNEMKYKTTKVIANWVQFLKCDRQALRVNSQKQLNACALFV